MRLLLSVTAALAFALVASGCEKYSKPNQPLPEGVLATTFDGKAITRESLKGKPWVLNLWLPN